VSRDCGEHPVRAWARGEGLRMKELGRRLGVTQQTLHYWTTKRNCPSTRVMALIESVTGGAVSASDCINYFMEKTNGER
jgi:DNA-binding transcriptional regulator YiaG